MWSLQLELVELEVERLWWLRSSDLFADLKHFTAACVGSSATVNTKKCLAEKGFRWLRVGTIWSCWPYVAAVPITESSHDCKKKCNCKEIKTNKRLNYELLKIWTRQNSLLCNFSAHMPLTEQQMLWKWNGQTVIVLILICKIRVEWCGLMWM